MADNSFKNSAHDLNNILTSLMNGIDLLKNTLPKDNDTDKIISGLEKSVKRASDIVSLHITPNGSGKRHIRKVNVIQVINEVIESFNTEERKLFKNKFDPSVEMPPILIDETDLYRVLLNLFKNAVEAVDTDGEITIIHSLEKVNGRSFLKIEVIDNGAGISEENLLRIFEPEFSTKQKKQESGYGLYIVKEKIEEYGGKIEASSKSKETKFTIYLPAYVRKEDQSANILLAEDDISVSEVLSDLLRTQGYNVAVAKTGIEAIDEIQKSLFDVLIIDKKMPEMDGIELIKQFRAHEQTIPVILASGSDVDLQSSEMIDLKINHVIKKPYNFPEILSALQKFNL